MGKNMAKTGHFLLQFLPKPTCWLLLLTSCGPTCLFFLFSIPTSWDYTASEPPSHNAPSNKTYPRSSPVSPGTHSPAAPPDP